MKFEARIRGKKDGDLLKIWREKETARNKDSKER